MAEPIQIPIDELRELYVVQGLSIYAIAKHHLKLSYNTIQDRVLKWRLDDERTAFIKEQTARFKQSSDILFESGSVPHNESESVARVHEGALINDKPSHFLQSPHPYAFAPDSAYSLDQINPNLTDPDEVKSAYASLSYARQQFVDLYVQQRRLPKQQRMTQEEMGERLNRNKVTISEYLADETIRKAINDASDGDYRFRLKQSTQDKILEEMESGKARPDIIKLGAQIAGLVEPDNTFNFNVNIVNKDSRLNRKG